MEEPERLLYQGDSIHVGNPVIPKRRKHCEACGRFVNGEVFVVHEHRPNTYVCNVMCGMKVADGKYKRGGQVVKSSPS